MNNWIRNLFVSNANAFSEFIFLKYELFVDLSSKLLSKSMYSFALLNLFCVVNQSEYAVASLKLFLFLYQLQYLKLDFSCNYDQVEIP